MSDPRPRRAALARALPALAMLCLLAPARGLAQESFAAADGNEFACIVDAVGSVCDPQFDGGVWPVGTPDRYVYNAGLVVAGVVSAGVPFAWAGDTVPAFFFDYRGVRHHGSPISNVYSSGRAADHAAWPTAGTIEGFPFASATITDGDLFTVTHLGRRFASELDTWTLFWDGDPALNNQRLHPLGIAVEQRTMQWTAPVGAQSVIFIAYRVTNVTNLPVFREASADAFFDGDVAALPSNGWALDSVFVGFSMDADVTSDATENQVLLLPGFAAVAAYHDGFVAQDFDYRPDLFHPPFFGDAPGMVASAMVYADAPGAAGGAEAMSRIVSAFPRGGGCVGCDPNGALLWQHLSGHAGVEACSVADPIAAGWCHAPQVPDDVKHYQSVGPWSLEPGQAATVVFAMVAAPTVATPEITVGGTNPPVVPVRAPGCDGDPIAPVQRAAGWLATPVCPPAGGRVDPDFVETVPGSLLNRIQIARAFAASGFLEPFAPDPVEFHVVPADTAVHVVWQPSATETSAYGDPYHDVASDSTSALYNPNYRRQDVEGYRVYRSIDRVNWQMIAQFDHDTTFFRDHLCETSETHVAGAVCADTVDVPIVDSPFFGAGYFVQYRPGDILESALGQPIVVDADTASAGHSAFGDHMPSPLLYTDGDVRAGFRYFYQVRAFDVNSYRSGPSSIESYSDTKSIVVQADFANRAEGGIDVRLESANGTRLDPGAPLPAIDPETGVFSGPMPATNAIEPLLHARLDLVPDFGLVVTIDSVDMVPQSTGLCVSGYGGGTTIVNGGCWRMFLTTELDGVLSDTVLTGFTPLWDSFGEAGSSEFDFTVEGIAADSARLGAIGAPADFVTFDAQLAIEADESIFNSTWEGQSNRRFGSGLYAGGSRWFDGTTETVADPTYSVRVGRLAGIDTIWSPDAHHTPTPTQPGGFPNSANMQWWGYTFSQIARAADFRVTWNDGTITVEDVTHGVPVAFDSAPTGQGWAFVPDGNGNGMIDDYDFFQLEGVADVILAVSGGLSDPATALPGEPRPVVMPTNIAGVEPASMTPGPDGFGLLLNTQRFIFRPSGIGLPADGTVWTLRTYHGVVTAADAATTNPSGYAFTAQGTVPSTSGANGILDLRPPFVPGLRVVFEGSAPHFEGAADLARVHTVPDPFYYHSAFGSTAQDRGRVLRFVNLPPSATIRIYSLTGILVDVIHHDDAATGIATWDLRTRDDSTAAPGIYFFHVSAPGADEHIGRFTIVTSGRYVE